MKRNIQSIMNRLQENVDGTISGGFGSIRGGFSNSGVINNCTNDDSCTGNNSQCTNQLKCDNTTNYDGCSNQKTCFA